MSRPTYVGLGSAPALPGRHISFPGQYSRLRAGIKQFWHSLVGVRRIWAGTGKSRPAGLAKQRAGAGRSVLAWVGWIFCCPGWPIPASPQKLRHAARPLPGPTARGCPGSPKLAPSSWAWATDACVLRICCQQWAGPAPVLQLLLAFSLPDQARPGRKLLCTASSRPGFGQVRPRSLFLGRFDRRVRQHHGFNSGMCRV
jgi:hypothetical protein